MFKNPFSFEGRIGRMEYAYSLTLYFIVHILIQAMITTVPVLSLLYIPLLWFLIAQGTKRCHDLQVHGFVQIVPFFVFWLIFKSGNDFSNSVRTDLNPIPQEPTISYRHRNLDIERVSSNNYSTVKNTTIIAVKNTSYSTLQDILTALRTIPETIKLSYEYVNTEGEIKLKHLNTTSHILESLHKILTSMEVIEFSGQHITIKIK